VRSRSPGKNHRFFHERSRLPRLKASRAQLFHVLFQRHFSLSLQSLAFETFGAAPACREHRLSPGATPRRPTAAINEARFLMPPVLRSAHGPEIIAPTREPKTATKADGIDYPPAVMPSALPSAARSCSSLKVDVESYQVYHLFLFLPVNARLRAARALRTAKPPPAMQIPICAWLSFLGAFELLLRGPSARPHLGQR